MKNYQKGDVIYYFNPQQGNASGLYVILNIINLELVLCALDLEGNLMRYDDDGYVTCISDIGNIHVNRTSLRYNLNDI